jgi:hypothetical protein
MTPYVDSRDGRSLSIYGSEEQKRTEGYVIVSNRMVVRLTTTYAISAHQH